MNAIKNKVIIGFTEEELDQIKDALFDAALYWEQIMEKDLNENNKTEAKASMRIERDYRKLNKKLKKILNK